MYTLLLGIQYGTIFFTLIEATYILRKWTKPLHGYLFLYCIAALVNNAGCLAVMLARTQDEALLAKQFSYLGRVWIPYAIMRFGMLLCEEKFFSRLSLPLVCIHATTYVMVLTTNHHKLYYTNLRFVESGLFPHMEYSYGSWHHLFNALIMFYVVYGLITLTRTFLKKKNPTDRKRVLYFLIAIMSTGIFFILEITGVGAEYDMTVLGYSISSIFLSIAIFRYDLLDTKELARNFVVNRLSEAIIAVDTDGCIGYFNNPAVRLFPDLAGRGDKTAVIEKIKGLIAKGTPIHKDSRIYTLKENQLLRDGQQVGTAYIIIDETEHFHHMEELKEQKLIADMASKAKGEFLSNMSHEIRTPINAVLGLDEMILRECDNDIIRSYAGDIKSSGRMLLAIINDILDFSKIEAGKMEIIPNQYDASALISDLVNMIATRAESKDLDFTVDIDSGMPFHLVGDDTRIKQCILNLLTNAVKYTREGGVTLSFRHEKKDDSHITLTVEVKDTGIGIKEDDLKKLYLPFERIEENRNRTIEGTGLGMSIVKNLLSAMGTQLIVQSEYGKGSVFSFSVVQGVSDWTEIGDWKKTHKAYSHSSDTGNYEETFQAPNARILAVDDTPMNLTVIRGLLKMTRIQLDTATDAATGLEMARHTAYNLLLIDHRMPNMDGIEMLKNLRADGTSQNQSATCLILTANAISGAREMYLAAGFADYLSKPLDSKKLEAALQAYLPRELILRKGDKGFIERKDGKWNGIERRKINGSAGDALIEELFDIDINAALKNCGGKGTFMEAVRGFWDAIAEKSGLIDAYAEAEDWKNYTVLVHALKSSARLIGAEKLGEDAAYLEQCGDIMLRTDDGDHADTRLEIIRKTPKLLSDYRSYRAKLAPLCGGTADEEAEAKPPITPAMLEDALSVLREAASVFDSATADALIAELENYSLPQDFAERYADIKKSIRSADWDTLKKLLIP